MPQSRIHEIVRSRVHSDRHAALRRWNFTKQEASVAQRDVRTNQDAVLPAAGHEENPENARGAEHSTGPKTLAHERSRTAGPQCAPVQPQETRARHGKRRVEEREYGLQLV